MGKPLLQIYQIPHIGYYLLHCSEKTINASKGYINYLRLHQGVEQKPGSWTLQYVNTIILTSFHYLQEIEELVEGIYAGFENPPRTCNINIVNYLSIPIFFSHEKSNKYKY